MKTKLKLMFIFMGTAFLVLGLAAGADGQGIGDRNRPADSGDGRYGIQGKVYLPNGKPAGNVRAVISSADSAGSSAVSNMDGVFQVGGLRAGNYSVSVSLDGFQTETDRLTIDRFSPIGRTFNVVFHLRAEQVARDGSSRAGVISVNPLLADVPDDALAKFQKGIDRLVKNDPKGAILHLDEAIASYPRFTAAYYERGAAFLKTNELDKALESFVKAIAIKPDYLEAKYSVGYTQFTKKNYEVAAAIFDDVLKQKKEFPEAQMYLGISLHFLKNIDAAEALLKLAIAGGSQDVALAHRYLGGIYLQKKRPSEAAAELQKYLELVPRAPDADRLKDTIADLRKKP
jgi:Tfp pilus assembly protein PilF